MKLFIKPHNDIARELYRNHGHFHDGDAGLDLYVLEDIHFQPGERGGDRYFDPGRQRCDAGNPAVCPGFGKRVVEIPGPGRSGGDEKPAGKPGAGCG